MGFLDACVLGRKRACNVFRAVTRLPVAANPHCHGDKSDENGVASMLADK